MITDEQMTYEERYPVEPEDDDYTSLEQYFQEVFDQGRHLVKMGSRNHLPPLSPLVPHPRRHHPRIPASVRQTH